MPYKFRVVLGGLCAVVPTPARTAVRALMVNTDPAAGHGRVAELSHTPELHTPTLRYDRNHELGNPPGAAPIWAAMQFDRQEISVAVAQKKPNSLTITGALTGGKVGASKIADRDLDWVPDLADVLPAAGKGKVEPDCLAPDPKKGYLSARVQIDHGTLRVDEFARFQGEEVQVEFVPNATGATIQRQAIPHRLAWEFDVPDRVNPLAGQSPFEPVTIQSRRFGQANPIDVVRFEPAAGTTAVQVFLVNLCCGDYFNPRPQTRLEDDDDFECFYMLLDNFSTLIVDKPLPIPVGVQLPLVPPSRRASGGGASGIQCSMCRVAAQ
jgi:hypothetical protein